MKKLTIATLLAAMISVFGATSAFASLINYEKEPNDSFSNATFAPAYNFDEAVNYGYISSSTDIDNWSTFANLNKNYKIILQSPAGVDYNFVVYEKINGSYQYVASSTAGMNQDDVVIVPGLRPDNSVREYMITVFSQWPTIYDPNNRYALVIMPQ